MASQPTTSKLTDSCINILKDLVSFDTTSRYSNLNAIDYIERLLSQYRIASTRVVSSCGKKSNLYATIGPSVAGGVILSGHTDVVPVDGQPWDTDPFSLTPVGDKLYGRGTADMKSFVAACLALLPEMVGKPLQKPIHFAFSYDEEVGCLGAPAMVEEMARILPKPAVAIVGEPTLMQVVGAHKGVYSFETEVIGVEAHSSRPQQGVNAVHIACGLVHFLTQMQQENAQNGTQDVRFEPPFSTIHVGVIQGGTARNIIPRHCKFCWEIRPLPGEDAEPFIARFEQHCETINAQIRASFPEAGIHTRPQSRMPGFSYAGDDAARQLVMASSQSNAWLAVPFGTEAGIFQRFGIPAILCGPGDIAQAHQPNEWIEISQIERCVAFLLRLTEALREPA